MTIAVSLESLPGQLFLALTLDEDAHSILKVLLGSILRSFMPWQFTKLWHIPSLEEIHIIQRVLLITAPVDFETVYNEVFWS